MNPYLQFNFQILLIIKYIQKEKISLKEFVYRTILFQWQLFQYQTVHQDFEMMDSETAFQLQTNTYSLFQWHYQYLLAFQDFILMEIETLMIQLIPQFKSNLLNWIQGWWKSKLYYFSCSIFLYKWIWKWWIRRLYSSYCWFLFRTFFMIKLIFF
jgi:hypothetical protein